MKTLIVFITILFSIATFSADKKSKDEAIFNYTVKKFNSYSNYEQLLKNQNLSAVDVAWLKQQKLNGQMEVPKMTVTGPMQVEIIVGKKIVNLEYKSNEQQFMLNNYALDLNSRTSLKDRIEYIQRVLSYTKFTWAEFFINKAYADVAKSAFDLSFAIDRYIEETQKSFSFKNVLNKSNKTNGLLVKSLLDESGSDVIGLSYSCRIDSNRTADGSGDCGELSLEVDRINAGLEITKQIHKVKMPRPEVNGGCSLPDQIKLEMQTEIQDIETGQTEMSEVKKISYAKVSRQSEESISKIYDKNTRVGQALVKCCGDFNDKEKDCFKDLQAELLKRKPSATSEIKNEQKKNGNKVINSGKIKSSN